LSVQDNPKFGFTQQLQIGGKIIGVQMRIGGLDWWSVGVMDREVRGAELIRPRYLGGYLSEWIMGLDIGTISGCRYMR
jgi:hypothetical protein